VRCTKAIEEVNVPAQKGPGYIFARLLCLSGPREARGNEYSGESHATEQSLGILAEK
jgi:hypothetical protein